MPPLTAHPPGFKDLEVPAPAALDGIHISPAYFDADAHADDAPRLESALH